MTRPRRNSRSNIGEAVNSKGTKVGKGTSRGLILGLKTKHNTAIRDLKEKSSRNKSRLRAVVGSKIRSHRQIKQNLSLTRRETQIMGSKDLDMDTLRLSSICHRA